MSTPGGPPGGPTGDPTRAKSDALAAVVSSASPHVMIATGPATAAASGPAIAAASGLTPAIAKRDISGLRFARSVEPRDQLNPASTIGVYVYGKEVNPLNGIDTFQNHLFAVINHVNANEYNTTVYNYQEFIDFMNSPAVHSISPTIAVMPVTSALTMAAPIPPAATARSFAVGKYNKGYSDGWRRVTEVEWKDHAVQAKLVEAHRQGGGWPLLEEPLLCNTGLCVAEGGVRIDDAWVTEVGFTGLQQLSNVYPAMNWDTKVAWTTTAPALGNNWTVSAANGNDFPCLFRQCDIAVGKYNTNYGNGWRRVTEVEWKDQTVQAALVKAHQEGGGWPLLEEPFHCNGVLWVAEGKVQIDGAQVTEVGFNGSQQLRGVYPAMNYRTEVAWTTTAPALDNKWTVSAGIGQNYPCLFIRGNPVTITRPPP